MLAADSSLLEVQHLHISPINKPQTINSHEKELFGLDLAVEMFDVVEDCQKHFLFWDFMRRTHFVFMCACILDLDCGHVTVVDNAIHVEVEVVESTVSTHQ